MVLIVDIMLRNKIFLLGLVLVFLQINGIKALDVGVCTACSTSRGHANEDRSLVRQIGDYNLFGVFDGHGGSRVSEYLRLNFASVFAKHFSETLNNGIFVDIFSDIDSTILRSIKAGGSTAVVACVKNDVLWISNVGDSKALFYQDSQIFPTVEHAVRNLSNPIVAADIEMLKLFDTYVVARSFRNACGALFEKGIHIFNVSRGIEIGLAMTRAVGDYSMKQCGLTCIPDSFEKHLKNDGTEFLILASDGFWDCFEDKYVCEMVLEAKNEPGMNAKKISQYLVDQARERDGSFMDDVTVITVLFDKHEEAPKQ